MSFFIRDDEVLDKYDKIWDTIQNKLVLNLILGLFTVKNTYKPKYENLMV